MDRSLNNIASSSGIAPADPFDSLPRELLRYIFSFVYPQEAGRIWQVCKTFNAQRCAHFEEILTRNGLTLEIRVVTREDARWLAEKPFRERWCALNAVLQQIEDFLENEDDEETLSQHSQQFRLANTNSPADTSWEWLPWQYATNFIPRTLGAEYRGQPPTPNELMTPEVMEICKRVRFELGHYTRTRIVEGQRVTPQEWVDARMLVHALRELMDQLREMKPEFWLLEDGSQL